MDMLEEIDIAAPPLAPFGGEDRDKDDGEDGEEEEGDDDEEGDEGD